jgi:hypothetical protein
MANTAPEVIDAPEYVEVDPASLILGANVRGQRPARQGALAAAGVAVVERPGWDGRWSALTACPTAAIGNDRAPGLVEGLCRPQDHPGRGRAVHPHRPAVGDHVIRQAMETYHPLLRELLGMSSDDSMAWGRRTPRDRRADRAGAGATPRSAPRCLPRRCCSPPGRPRPTRTPGANPTDEARRYLGQMVEWGL